MPENKIARICWNTEGWRKPSGPRGKSESKEAYERRMGYGHEEWLLDVTKLIDGWHYSYLQPIGRYRLGYVGKSFNIGLYSINGVDHTRWWIGQVNDVEVISPDKSNKVYGTATSRCWGQHRRFQ